MVPYSFTFDKNENGDGSVFFGASPQEASQIL